MRKGKGSSFIAEKQVRLVWFGFEVGENLQNSASSLLGLAVLAGGTRGASASITRALRVPLTNLTDNFIEGLFNVNAGLGGRLEEGATQRLGQVLTLLCVHFTLILKIALVSKNATYVSFLCVRTDAGSG